MTATKPTIVDLYCRTASLEQRDTTPLDQQEAACRAYCEQHGLSIGMLFREAAPGHTYRDREGLSLLRRRYRAGETQGVVVTHLDRLSRNTIHLIILMEELEVYHVRLYCVAGSEADSPTFTFIRTMVEVMTEVAEEKVLDPLLREPEH